MKKTILAAAIFLASQPILATTYSCKAIKPKIKGLGVVNEIVINEKGTLAVTVKNEDGKIEREEIEGVVETQGDKNESLKADWDYGEHSMTAISLHGEIYLGFLVYQQDFTIEVRCEAKN